MRAMETLEAVSAIGASLSLKGDRLLLNVPDKNLVTNELREAIQANKAQLTSLLCPHFPNCPHSDADLIEEFRNAGKVRVEYRGGDVWLVSTREHAAQISTGTIYTLEEWTRLSDLPDEQIRAMHALRTIGGPGGSIEVKP